MHVATKRAERRHRSEEGSIPIALVVILIVSGLLIAVLTTVHNGLKTARADQNRTNAFQHANAGIDQALYRIDKNDLPGFNVGSYEAVAFNANGLVSHFRDTVQRDGSRFEVDARQEPPGQATFWTVRSLGTDRSGRQRLAVATVGARPLFMNGFFTETAFDLTGEQTGPIAYRSSLCQDPRLSPTAPGCNVAYPVPGRLGTNSNVILSSATVDEFKARWEGFNMYGRASQEEADAACTIGGSAQQCGTSPFIMPVTERFDTTPPTPEKMNANLLGCPFPSNTVTDTTIPAGDYECDELHLRGTVTMGGTVRIWVKRNFTADGSGSGRAVVNAGERPQKFQLYFPATTNSNGDVISNPSTICRGEIWGLLYSPGLNIDCNGSHQPTLYGAVIARIHDAGGAHFNFHWDLDSQYALNDGTFAVEDWRECPSRATADWRNADC